MALDLERTYVSPLLLEIVPAALARQLCVMPFGILQTRIRLAVPDDGGDSLIATIKSQLGNRYEMVTTPRENILHGIERHYGSSMVHDPRREMISTRMMYSAEMEEDISAFLTAQSEPIETATLEKANKECDPEYAAAKAILEKYTRRFKK